jgi:hypothetical protein
MEKTITPIAIFVYNRPEILSLTLNALKNNVGIENHPLIFFCDGPKANSTKETIFNISQVHDIIDNIDWALSVTKISKKENRGLANSLVEGITTVLKDFDRVIVLEDDIKTSKYFLQFMNDGLVKYENCETVASISGFNYPLENTKYTKETFFLLGSDCWGWATWKRGWDLFEIDGKILLEKLIKSKKVKHFDFNGNYKFSNMLKKTIKVNHSWAVKWYASTYLSNKITLYPLHSLVQNIGDKGTNVQQNNKKMLGYETKDAPISYFETDLTESIYMRKIISNHFGKYYNIFYRFYNFIEQKLTNL